MHPPGHDEVERFSNDGQRPERTLLGAPRLRDARPGRGTSQPRLQLAEARADRRLQRGEICPGSPEERRERRVHHAHPALHLPLIGRRAHATRVDRGPAGAGKRLKGGREHRRRPPARRHGCLEIVDAHDAGA